MVNQVVTFDVKTLLNVTEFKPTAFWITVTLRILFLAANRKRRSRKHLSFLVDTLLP